MDFRAYPAEQSPAAVATITLEPPRLASTRSTRRCSTSCARRSRRLPASRRALPAADRRGPRLFERRRPRRRRRPARRCRRGAGGAFQPADRGDLRAADPGRRRGQRPLRRRRLLARARRRHRRSPARSAYFLQAFVNIGLIPDAGATWLLPRLAGRARAMEMMMLGERIPAEQALEWGLISRVVDGRGAGSPKRPRSPPASPRARPSPTA